MSMRTVLLLGLLLLLRCLTAAELPWDDPAPHALLYAGFNDAKQPVSDSRVSVQNVTLTEGKIGQALQVAKSRIICGEHRLDPRRGSLACWVKTNATGGFLLHIWPGPPAFDMSFTPKKPDPKQPDDPLKGEITFTVKLGDLGDGHYEYIQTIGTGAFAFTPSEWHHVVWTWVGVRHTVFLDGKPAASQSFDSPMPTEQGKNFVIGPPWGTPDAAIDELAIYNFAMSPAEVQAAFTATESKPITPIAAHGLTVSAEWAPGEGQAYVSADAGNDGAQAVTKYGVDVLNETSNVLAHNAITTLRRGFGELLLPIGAMTPGAYHAVVKAYDAAGKIVATQQSEPYVLPQTAWLGNKLGISSQLQPPWTPITRKGDILGVWGREYTLNGGFGLPQQITSQGKTLLSQPLTLELVQNGAVLPITLPRVKVLQVKPEVAQWEGTAVAGGVNITVTGHLEYDGMMLFTVRLAPGKAPVNLDAIRLQMVLPSERAPYMHTATDQTYWWYTYKANTATTPGVFHTNLKQKSGASRFLPVVLFSDNDRGLEWFADNPSGWQVDERKPMQEMIREQNGDVRLQCHLANQPFTLAASLEITFGMEATPVKPLPADWRTTIIHYAPLPLKSDLAVWWSWPDDQGKKGRQGTFNLCPVDVDAYRTAFTGARKNGIKIAPFTNAHVLLPHPPDDWTALNAVIGAETRNDGWIAQPKRGFRDYWAYQLNRWLDSDGIDAIYIDESYAFGAKVALLAGGYVKEDGTHGPGYNLLGIREQMKRTRQLFIDHKKRPIVWLHTTACMWPHAWAFADIVSDGEAFMFEKPTGPDWIDQWGAKLLESASAPGATGGPWLLSLNRAQKFGFTPVFLDYIKYYNAPEYPQAVRTMYAVLALLDIIPINTQPWFAQVKQDFGIGATDVQFRGYWEQAAVQSERADVKASYYTRNGSALLIVSNLGKEPYDGKLTVDFKALGLDAAHVVLRDAEKQDTFPYTVQDGAITLMLPRHDLRMIRVQEQR